MMPLTVGSFAAAVILVSASSTESFMVSTITPMSAPYSCFRVMYFWMTGLSWS